MESRGAGIVSVNRPDVQCGARRHGLAREKCACRTALAGRAALDGAADYSPEAFRGSVGRDRNGTRISPLSA